jgi:phosphoglycolate phosphatase
MVQISPSHSLTSEAPRQSAITSSRGLMVFDLDGTLADTADDLVASVNALLVRDGLAPLNDADLKRMVGAGGRALLTRAYGAHGMSPQPEQLEMLFRDFLNYYEENICVHTRLFEGVEGALDRLHADGWAFAVCTNKFERSSKLLLHALGIDHRMRFICGQNTFAYCKPDPRTLWDTIKAAGGHAHRALMVGDSRTDIDTAKAADVPVIGVSFGYTDQHVRELGADGVIDHFDELYACAQDLLPPEAV